MSNTAGTAVVPPLVLHAGNTGYKGPVPTAGTAAHPEVVWNSVKKDYVPYVSPSAPFVSGPFDTPETFQQKVDRMTAPAVPHIGQHIGQLPLARGYGGEDLSTPVRELIGQNPKTLMGRKRLPVSSVLPWPALLRIAEAMQYGAFEAPRADGEKGYQPFNWREQAVEAMTYLDACDRHKARWLEGQEIDPKSLATELSHAAASLIILIDAIENGTWLDNRPKVRKQTTGRILDNYESQRKE